MTMYFTSNPPVIDSLGGSFISETKPSPRFLHDPDHNSALVTGPGCFERAQRHNTPFRFRFWACRRSATLERRTACAMSAHGMPCWASKTVFESVEYDQEQDLLVTRVRPTRWARSRCG